MRISVHDPLSPRQARLFIVGCALAFIVILIGSDYLRPYLDRKSRETFQRKQVIEQQIERQSREAREDCAASPGCDPSRRVAK